METTITADRRADALDTEQFRAMIEGPHFARFLNRVREMRVREVATCCTGDDVRRAQGAAAALATVLDLPAQLLAELQGGSRYQHPMRLKPSNGGV